jgi:hypothetical protein
MHTRLTLQAKKGEGKMESLLYELLEVFLQENKKRLLRDKTGEPPIQNLRRENDE